MIRRSALALLLSALCALLALPAVASAAGAPAWSLTATASPSNFASGQPGGYYLIATNLGAGSTVGTSTLAITLPAPLIPKSVGGHDFDRGEPPLACKIEAQTLFCETSEPIAPGRQLVVNAGFEVPGGTPAQALEAHATVSGGGAAQADASVTAPIQAAPTPFAVTDPLLAPLTDPDGGPASLSGSHAYGQLIHFGFPVARSQTETGSVALSNSGHPRDINAELPRGTLVDPAATSVRCTEAELIGIGCPDSSQVGTVAVTTIILNPTLLALAETPLYNMVPPPGAPAELATDVVSTGIFAHIIGSLRSESDFGIQAGTPDVLALGTIPLFDLDFQLWGDPSAAVHDANRGQCDSPHYPGNSCPVARQKTPFLTMPGDCSGAPPRTELRADSWEAPGSFVSSIYQNADLQGNPVSMAGCNALEFQPTISSQPTTNLADSPTGLDVDLHQPQEAPHEEPLSGRGSTELRDARVTLPPGMAVNPSQADGLAACSEDEIGYLPEDEEAGIHFSKEPQSCPDAAKLGTLEVSSPLLAEYEDSAAGAATQLATDPETGAPLPRPLQGSVYLAKPFENPFGSLLAIYLAVEDPQSGIVAKLAGRVEADPQSGQLRTVFTENPELPLEDVKLHLFGGARASLITPLTCGTHTIASDLTPWSAPEGLDAHPESSFQTSAEPGGGSCPASEGAAANKPAFSAGTLAPQAGAYSPFVLKLSREDGTQRIAGIDTTLPPGLSGKLAGIGQCSEAQIAGAKAREKPNEGILERQRPSCPASSEVGSVDVAAGAGPTPFHTSGHAYLAGPYKGAPLSVAVIVPAVAGPFDLGAVVSRVALYLNPDTAQIHAVSDPLPQILEGIPLDVRSIALTMGRPQFTLNPTSCDPMQVTGSALSALGQSASLSNPFQVGGCPQLPFKPKLSLKLKGGTRRTGHPKLIATLKAKAGEANVAQAQVKLPPSAFLDQAHIRTVCTRVQFAANACPSGSIYGTATAVTPLLSDPLSGNVYLRSSSHKLPDLVVALKGPASLPIEIDLDGKTDAVKGALRNSFEAVPDAPVSSFRLELFGGKKGLVVNSRNLCAHSYKAEVNLTGQNGKVFDTEPAVGTDCKGHKKRRHRHRSAQ